MSACRSDAPPPLPPRTTMVVDPFCFRQFSEKQESAGYSGTVFSLSIAQFEAIVNERYHHQESNNHDKDKVVFKDGYAPFCKHFFVTNDFTDATVNVLPITRQNEHLLRTTYEARNEKELPVLTRHFPKELVCQDNDDDDDNGNGGLPVAQYLDLILYSRDQINLENAAMKNKVGREKEEAAPWGIISIKAQNVDFELPMTPITMMRNALGKNEGGSGVPLVRQDYLESVEYWKNHANVS